MADVDVAADIERPAEQVWAVVGDFGGIRRWATVVQEERVEDTPGGPLRTLTMADGKTVRELRIAASDLSYTYTIEGRPDLAEYRSTIAVVPLAPRLCRLLIVVHVVPGSGSDAVSDEELTERYARFIRGNLKAMRRAVEAAAG